MSQKDLDSMEKDQSQESSTNEQELEHDRQFSDSELANIIEAALFAAKEPLGVRKLISLFPDDAQPTKVDIQNVILTLEQQCKHRGVELQSIGNGWRYQTKQKYSPWLRKLSGQKTPRYSRALLETLSIIAYRQPVTRGDIEEIRGVGVSSDTIRTLEERGWIAQIGHRDVPGRPALFGTSQGFLEYFNMSGLNELPELMDKRDLNLIAKDMNLTLPMDGVHSEADIVSAQVALEQSNSNSEDTVGNAADNSVNSADVIELHPTTYPEETVVDESMDGKNDHDDYKDNNNDN